MKPVTLQQTQSETRSSVLRNTWPGWRAPETRVCPVPFPKSLRFSVLQFELFGVLFSTSTAVCLGTEAAATTTALPHPIFWGQFLSTFPFPSIRVMSTRLP